MATSSSERDDEAIRDYIRQHLQANTREAIRAALVAQGHDPARVDDIWEQEWTGARQGTSSRALSRLAMRLFLACGVAGCLGALAWTGLQPPYSASARLPFLATYVVGYTAIGLGIWKLVGWAADALNIGGKWSYVVGIVLIPAYVALMFGGCLAADAIAPGG